MAISSVLPISSNVYIPNPLVGIEAAQAGANYYKSVGDPFSSALEGYMSGKERAQKYRVTEETLAMKKQDIANDTMKANAMAKGNAEKLEWEKKKDIANILIQQDRNEIARMKASSKAQSDMVGTDSQKWIAYQNSQFSNALAEASSSRSGDIMPALAQLDLNDPQTPRKIAVLDNESKEVFINKVDELSKIAGGIPEDQKENAIRLADIMRNQMKLKPSEANKAAENLTNITKNKNINDWLGADKKVEFKLIPTEKIDPTGKKLQSNRFAIMVNEEEVGEDIIKDLDPNVASINSEMYKQIKEISKNVGEINKYNANLSALQNAIKKRQKNEEEEMPAKTASSQNSPIQNLRNRKNSYSDLISEKARKYGIDEKLLESLIAAESNFDPNAKSPVGAMGLGQLMPGTAKDLGVTDPYDPEQNIEGAAKYIKQLQNKFGKENIDIVLSAYNWGPGNIEKSIKTGKMPPKETINYIQRIKKLMAERGKNG